MRVIGSGSIVQRDKARPRSRCRDWELSVHVEDAGRRKRRTRAFHGTYTQATAALRDFMSELEGTPVTADMPFSEWCGVWMGRRRDSMSYSAATLEGDRSRCAAACMHLTGSVGGVTADDVRALYNALADGKTPSGRAWKPKSIEGMHKTLTTIFADAVKSRVTAFSPMDGVTAPKVPKKRYTAISAAQMDALLDSLDYSNGSQRAVALCAACGLRRREAVELEWRDLGGELSVVNSKTEAGVRRVPVPSWVLARLEPYRGGGRVSGLSDPHSLTRWWERNRGRFGLSCTLHDLRRSWASRLAAAGVHPRVMMELGGWESIDVAMEVYTQVSGGQRSEAVRAAFGRVSGGFPDGEEKGQEPD